MITRRVLTLIAMFAAMFLAAPVTVVLTGATATAEAPATATLTAAARPTVSAEAAHLAHLAHLHHLHMLHLAQLAKKAAPAASSRDSAALSWAVANAAGHWYLWGGTGPSYDCSGLVMVAYEHEGINLPHNTVAMLNSGHLIRVTHPARGDLAFFGTGHVEFYVSGHTTFGAHHSGEQISYRSWNAYYAPTAFYAVR
jgi:cell wall-associated NlpC family hydrolase